MKSRLLFSIVLVCGLAWLFLLQSAWGQCDRRSDSLELVKLYNSTGGANWKNKWDLKKPMSGWYGVSLNTKGCISCLDLGVGRTFCQPEFLDSYSGNGMVGILPDLNLPQLEKFILSGNKLSGQIPNLNLPKVYEFHLAGNHFSQFVKQTFLSNLGNGPYAPGFFRIQLNKLTFDDLIPNVQIIQKIGPWAYYAPQDSIYRDTTILLQAGQTLSLDLGIDASLTTNRYQWYKNGQLYGTASNSNKFSISNLKTSDAGTYRVQVTNPDVPQLTLYSKAIRLQVAGCATNANAKLSSTATRDTLCPSTPLILTASGGATYRWSTGQTTSSISLSVTKSQNYQVTITDASNCPTTLSKNIVQAAIPTASISTAPAAICPGKTLNLAAVHQNGVTYQWQRNSSKIGLASIQSALQITQSGTYTVKVSNALGCVATSSEVVIKDGIIPRAEILSSGQIICPNGGLKLKTQPNTTETNAQYQWLLNGNSLGPDAILSTYFARQEGAYTVKVSSGDGCEVISVAFNLIASNLSSTAKLNSTAPRDTLCPNTALTLTASSGSSYKWSTNQTTSSINLTVTQTQNYQVTITDANNCTSTLSKNIVQATVPNPAISANGTQICAGQSLELRGTAQSGVSFEWFNNGQSLGNPSTKNTYTITQAGAYTLRAQNQYGCAASSAELNIQAGTAPTATINAPSKIICAGGKLSLSATALQGAQYQWFRGELAVQGPNENRNYEATQAGDYKVRVSIGAACATTSAPWAVQQNPGTNNIKINLSPQRDTLCPGDSLRLTASGGQHYQWNIGSSSASIVVKPLQNSSYVVDVRDDAGCTTTLRQNIALAQAPSVRTQVLEQNCNHQIIATTTGGKKPYTFQWSNGASSSAIEVRRQGKYDLLVEDARRCQIKASMQVDSFGFLLEAPVVLNPSCGEKDGSITLKLNPQRGNYTIRWLPQNEGEGDNPRTQLAGGEYRAIVQDEQDCIDTINVKMDKITDCAANFIVYNSFSPNGDGVNERFVIQVKPNGACPSGNLPECFSNNELLVMNRWGEVVFKADAYQNDWGAKGLPGGAYFYVFFPNRENRDVVLKGAITVLK